MGTLYREPSEFPAGDTVSWTIKSADYPDYPADTFDLKYYFAGAVPKSFTADKSSGDFVVTVPADDSAEMNAGSTDLFYKFIARFEDGPHVYTARTGQVKVTPDLSTVDAGFEARDPDEVILAALENMAKNRASRAEMSRTVNGKAIGYMTMKEIRVEILNYRELVKRKRRERARKLGKKTSTAIKFNLGGPQWP